MRKILFVFALITVSLIDTKAQKVELGFQLNYCMSFSEYAKPKIPEFSKSNYSMANPQFLIRTKLTDKFRIETGIWYPILGSKYTYYPTFGPSEGSWETKSKEIMGLISIPLVLEYYHQLNQSISAYIFVGGAFFYNGNKFSTQSFQNYSDSAIITTEGNFYQFKTITLQGGFGFEKLLKNGSIIGIEIMGQKGHKTMQSTVIEYTINYSSKPDYYAETEILVKGNLISFGLFYFPKRNISHRGPKIKKEKLAK